MKTQLLCTFSRKLDYPSVIDKIKKFYDLSDPRLFVFETCNDGNSIVITYNVFITDDYLKKLPDTISVHRKKKTGTIYTLNAMNKIIEEENGGRLDRNFNLNWEMYKNCLIITSPNGYRVIEIQLIEIYRF